MIDKIGNRLVASLQPKEKPYQVHDKELRRFFIRVQPSGAMNYYCSISLPNGKRTVTKIGSSTRIKPAQARDEALRILADVSRGVNPNQPIIQNKDLRSFLEQDYEPWLKSRGKNGEERNDIKAEARARATLKMIKTSFPDLLPRKMNEISPWLIEKWKMNTLNDGAKPATVNRKMDALRAAFTKAVLWGRDEKLLEKNPFSQVEWCELDDNSVVRYLSDEEAKRLDDTLEKREQKIRRERRSGNALRLAYSHALLPDLDTIPFVDYLTPMVRLSRNLGLRRAELFHLERHHVDLINRMVTIIGDNSKNGKTRHIPLNRIAFETFRAWIEQNEINEGLIFSGRNGKPMNNVNKAWKSLLKDAQISNFRWHDQRHDFASRLVMAGVDLNTVRDLLGHADLKMTLRYAHLAPKVKADAVAKLDLDRPKNIPELHLSVS